MLFHIMADARQPRQQNVSKFRYSSLLRTERKGKAEHLHKSHIKNLFCWFYALGKKSLSPFISEII